MPDSISSIVYGFARQVKTILGNKLSKVIIYGSYARGDYQENSDIDIMILVKDMRDSEIRAIEERLCDLAFDIEMERELHISAFVVDEGHFVSWESTLPFYANVRREGIEVTAE